LVTLWGGFRVALKWLWGAYQLPINTHWGGFDVALMWLWAEGVSGGGNADENRRFEDPLSLTVKKQTTDSGSCRLVLRLA